MCCSRKEIGGWGGGGGGLVVEGLQICIISKNNASIKQLSRNKLGSFPNPPNKALCQGGL